VTVGNVLEVVLSPNPADRTVRVVYDVDRRAAPRLRKGTRASIKTIGLLGDKYIELEGGTAEEPEVEIGGLIPAAPGAGIEKLLEGSGDLLADLGGIARSLKNILKRTEEGKGFLGALTSESEESKKLGNGLTGTLASLNSILRRIDSGQGLAGKLLTDEKYGKETTDSLRAAVHSLQNVFARVDESMKNNTGALAALISDPEGKKKLYGFLDNLSTAATSLATVIAQLEKGNGTLAILLRDEKFGREFTGHLNSFSRSLDSIGKKLDNGTGTAGKLINDPAIFDAANHVVIGLDESWMLRWLIRDRQKSGINKEYNEAQKKQQDANAGAVAPEAAPAPAPTPTPRS
jgi:phospholipid/cholesterol/gamma-HCH transport system substrate-binding protein